MSSESMRIAVGTTNPAKLAAVRQAAGELFGEVEVLSVLVDSGVPDQPWGDDQTAAGALARASAAIVQTEADLGVGIESGLAEGPGKRLYVVSWAAAVDRTGRLGFGASERFAVPVEFEVRLRGGEELGPALDDVFGRPGLARDAGAVSIFTGGRRQRLDILSVAVLHALAALIEPWKRPRSE
jgi:inosine/xanthosine triphosphatase